MKERKNMKKIKVLIVDDSVLIRAIFAEMLAHEPDIEVVGTAIDPFDAREKIKLLSPDVITLDVEMPKMDGISFLEKIMALRPMPVIMVSSLTAKGADITIRALEIGAADFLTKPAAQNETSLLAMKHELHAKIRHAVLHKLTARSEKKQASNEIKPLSFNGNHHHKIIAIGASTGGVEALRDVLQALPANMPPIVVTQHMPAGFTTSFAARLDKICAARVHEAENLQVLQAGNIYIARGDMHMEIEVQMGKFVIKLRDGEPVSSHKPSVDVLFSSVAKAAGKRAIGVILTGMGHDGAEGLLKMREAGARTIGQSEASCVVYGMPKVAKSIGAVEQELSLSKIAGGIIGLCDS